ncbi:hypothetical protein [Flagellimonas marinaquae]|uniref:hypothetical protein n=1 Tax=Flagellimonas marinaquae TaxID=254955 RepID=UPI001F49E6E5|nr:hypothetical protein [Allomuricauda aquimarina]
MKELYSLRKDFTILGLTGKTGAGCSQIAKLLSNPNFNKSLNDLIIEETSDTDQLKLNICVKYLQNDNNWSEFKVLHYKDVLLFHLFYEATKFTEDKKTAIEYIITNITQWGGMGYKLNRLSDKDSVILDKLTKYLRESEWYDYLKENLTCATLKECLSDKKDCSELNGFYFGEGFEKLSQGFFDLINEYDLTKRLTLTHDLANNLRQSGFTKYSEETNDLQHIYTVAETINRLIKNWKRHQGNPKNKIVIDSLKNSLELMFFKEKYSAFYTIATNKSDIERKGYLYDKIKEKYGADFAQEHVENLLTLSSTEYKGNEVNKGNFSSPDIENCIQKSDYHVFFSNYIKDDRDLDKEAIDGSENLNSMQRKQLVKELESYPDLSIMHQLVKLMALIQQPGIIMPTAHERIMQIAYNAKLNSGCISRQVGAVVTDQSFSIKAVGWNDIPRFQIPCSLRNARDLISGKNKNHFSDFEKGEDGNYEDGKTFKTKITKDFDEVKQKLSALEGRNCSFCFKTFHNAYEGEKNQVHTRSLHAEENAMLQITKYGGQGLKNGNLFTTASPCELCSKKAFQLGVKRIYYIDPYPGIATQHILKNSKEVDVRPTLLMFQGAVGKAFHKLFEPFMAYKDELNIRIALKPSENVKSKVEKLTDDKKKQEEILSILSKDN